MVQHVIWSVLLCLLLAACGGGGGGSGGGGGGGGAGGSGGPPAVDPRLDRLDNYEAQKLRIFGDPDMGRAGLALTAPEDVPTVGTASFVGSATIRVEVPGDPLILFGDAVLDVNFQTGASTGTLDAFFGTSGNGNVVDYQGAITASGTSAGQDMTIGYAGALTGGGSSLTLDGSLQTHLLDTPIAAIAASELDAVVGVDGAARDATVIVVGEGAVVPPPDPTP